MKTNRTTARLFTRIIRWISVNHTGNTGETVIRIGTIPGEVLTLEMPINEFVKIYRDVPSTMTTEEGFSNLIANIDQKYMQPDLIDQLKNIEKTETPEEVIYFMKDDPAQVYPEFQSRI